MTTDEKPNSSLPATFTYHPSLEPYAVPSKQWLTDNDKHWDGLASSALVFLPPSSSSSSSSLPSASPSEDKILLVQRAAHDSMPGRWEAPGGAVDDDDPSILHGCARELREEAGLKACRIKRVVTEGPDREPGSVFTNRTGARFFCRFTFEVEVEADGDQDGAALKVRLDPNEHQAWLWASEKNILDGAVGETKLQLTGIQQRNILMEAFRLRKDGRRSDQHEHTE